MEVENQSSDLRPTADTMELPNTAVDGEAQIERLEALAMRVKKHLEACTAVMEKVQEGGEYNSNDETAVQTLRLFVDRLLTELKEYDRIDTPQDMKNRVKHFFELQCDAEELLVALNIMSKNKECKETSNASTSRLPKLELVQFNGDLMDWRRFWTRFHSAVDSRKDISDGDKMTYLVGVLKNEAKQAIAGLDETDENYNIALDRLKQRFGKTEHIIDAHYVALNKLTPANNEIRECRECLDKIEQHLRVLETLGENINQNNNLRSVIMEKFPENINYDLKMAIKANGYSVDNIRKALENIISARETSYPTTHELKRPAPEGTLFTTEALFSASHSNNGKPNARPSEPYPQRKSQDSRQEKKPRKECRYCQGNHYHDECDRYTTVSERKERLKDRCYICLGRSHSSRNCRFKDKRCFHCKEVGHHGSLCAKRFKEKTEQSTALVSQAESDTILQTLKANLYNEDTSKTTKGRLLFDTGSQKTYVSEKLALQLKLQPVEKLCLTIYTFGRTHPKYVSAALVQLKVGKSDGGYIDVTAHVIPNITGNIPSFQAIKTKIRQQYPGKQLAEDVEEDSPADLLIGNDQYYSFFTGSTEQIGNHLYLVESKLGWVASGKPDDLDATEVLSFLTYVQGELGKGCQQFAVPDPPLQDDNIRLLWDLESIGIRESLKIMEEDEVIKFFSDTTQFRDGRYYVKWPWSQYPSDLPVNYGMALGRLTGLLKRTDSVILQLYDEVLKDQLKKGVIEIVNESKLPTSHPVHYLPHHHVLQENKTTKLRIVYDASAKVKGCCSLNEYLFKGPLMLEDLITLLLNFRTHPVGIIADVEKAFLQVGLQEEDRDVTRFLWVKDVSKEPTKDNLLQYRFCRVPFGIISSPYLLAATVRHHLSLHHSNGGDKIAKDLYVDNLVTGTATPEEALELYATARNAFGGLSMNIREWNSNSKAFLDQIPNETKSDKTNTTSVLGLNWNPERDTLELALNPDITLRTVSTKREILRVIASVFDPCGLIAPLLLPAKLYLQTLWVEKYRWDSLLPKEKLDQWYTEVTPLNYIRNVKFPRYYFDSKNQTSEGPQQVELHCFTDASQHAYCAAVYVRDTSLKHTTVALVMSRTKLTPVKQRGLITIPRLELLGVLIGTRLMNYIQRSWKLLIKGMFLWTDSNIVLGWLKSSKLLPPFVSKRVTEINSNPVIAHRYVPTEQNPADLATRPSYTELPKMWFEGPAFLKTPIQEWPQEPTVAATVSSTALPAPAERLQGPSEIRSQGADNSSAMGERVSSTPPRSDSVTGENHLQWASTENDRIKRVQQQHFPKEMSGKSALTGSLGLFVDEQGLLRCQGRLQNADLPYDQKYPILLPKRDPFTQQLIKKTHEENHHVGVPHTLTIIRKRFWIPQGRSQVENVIKKCPVCVKYGGGPYKLPPMPPLPEERVRLCTPFTYTGLDYLGPLTITESGQNQKRWVCLFTCMATRAVRLEVVKNLSAEEFLLCLRRFVATQGPPLLIISDNAAQFKLAAEVIQSPLVKERKIGWHFIPELSPWQGGFYERLVGLVKHCLRRSLDKDLLSDNQLITILKEIETVLNSRPLTPVGKDLDCILTPSDFLSNCGTHPMIEPDGASNPNITATKSQLIEGWKKGQSILQEFASMFQNQYLARLRERAIVNHKQHRVLAKREPKVGDTVQIWDGHSKPSHRALWKVGKITALIRSHDGLVRTAQVLLDSGVTLNRSISFLYPLELENDENISLDESRRDSKETSSVVTTDDDKAGDILITTPPPESDDPISAGEQEEGNEDAEQQVIDEEAQSSSERPRRRAALLARKAIRGWTQSLIALSG